MKPSARPTQISVRAMRRDLLWRYGLERRHKIATLDDLRALVPTWAPAIFGDAVSDNVALSRFTVNAGRLVIEDAQAK